MNKGQDKGHKGQMSDRDAMKLALEALESASNNEGNFHDYKYAAEAIRQALEQQEQEQEPKCVAVIEVFGKDWRFEYLSLPVGKHKLYTQQYTYTAPPSKPLTEEEITETYNHPRSDAEMIEFVRAIEAAHGIGEKK